MDTIAFGVGARKVCWPDGYKKSAIFYQVKARKYIAPVTMRRLASRWLKSYALENHTVQ